MSTLPDDFTILAIETSCDETAAAVVRGGRTIVANIVASQMDMHQRYGGIVPEVASRQHIINLAPVIGAALAALPDGWAGIDAVAATYGPGLSGALLTGLNAAKAIAWQRGLPFVGVNHLEAHVYANWLAPDEEPTMVEQPVSAEASSSSFVLRPSSPPPQFPLVALVVSGGHTLLALLRGHGDYLLLGQTRDDAVGEAFDKVARILGLGYPGGPAIQQAAQGSHAAGVLPRAWLRDSYDFSFSGLKTAVLHKVQERQQHAARMAPPSARRPEAGGRRQEAGGRRPETAGRAAPEAGGRRPEAAGKRPQAAGQNAEPEQAAPALPTPPPPVPLDSQFVGQIAHAFQESVVDVLCAKAVEAARQHGASAIVLAGGVAANTRLRAELARRAGVPVVYPPLALCTDNAAMVAAAAFYRFAAGVQSGWDLDVVPGLRLGV